jgi:hypothetical protein
MVQSGSNLYEYSSFAYHKWKSDLKCEDIVSHIANRQISDINIIVNMIKDE